MVSASPVKPGPPAATYPRLAPSAEELTQNEYRRPRVSVNRKRTGSPATAARSGAAVQVTRARVEWPETGIERAAAYAGITRPPRSSTSTRRAPSGASRLTKRYFPEKVSGRVISVSGAGDGSRRRTRADAGESIDANPSRRSVARPVLQTPGALLPGTPRRPLQ